MFRLEGLALSERELSLTRDAANAYFPSGGPIPVSGVDAGCVEWLDRYAHGCRGRHRALISCVLWLNELRPLVIGPDHKRFSKLNANERLAHLKRAQSHSVYLFRLGVFALRGLLTMGYLINPEVMRHIGIIEDLDPFGLSDTN